MPSMARTIDETERFQALDRIMAVRAGKSNYGVSRNLGTVVPLQYGKTLVLVNRIISDEVKAFARTTYTERETAFEAIRQRINATPSSRIAEILHAENRLVDSATPREYRENEEMTANWVARDLALTALALREAKAQCGDFPTTLAELKGFTVPTDRFTEQPFIYRRRGAGYVLYSLGSNRKDDGAVLSRWGESMDIVVECKQ
jgi:hypothetical protein